MDLQDEIRQGRNVATRISGWKSYVWGLCFWAFIIWDVWIR